MLIIGEIDCVAYGRNNSYYFAWKIVPCSDELPYICKNDLRDTNSSSSPIQTGQTLNAYKIVHIENYIIIENCTILLRIRLFERFFPSIFNVFTMYLKLCFI